MTLLYDWLKAATKRRGNQKALVYRDNYLSWRGLSHRVDRRVQELAAIGLGRGAWVGLMLGNVPDFVILALALSKIEAAIVPLDPTTGTRELELMLAAAPLRALVTRPRGSDASQQLPSPPAKGRGRAVDKPPEEEAPEIRRRLQGTLLTCSVYKRPDPDFGTHPIAVMFTADSLGDPKGVLRTEENILAAVDNTIAALDLTSESRILTAVPLFHAYGWDIGLLAALKTGATMFVEEELSARRVGKVLRDSAIDVLPGTPAMYAELCRLPTAKPLKVKGARFLSAGSALDREVAETFHTKYGVRIMSCYHTTETSIVSLDSTAKAPTTVGKTIDGIDVCVAPDPGTKPATGKKAPIWVRGASVSPQSIGPYKDVEGPAAADVEVGQLDDRGWYRTGDIGKMDRYGRLSLTGREDDLVKIEGKRVALGEVEGCLESFSKIKEAKARLVTDALAGAMVVARVVASQACEAEEVIDHCARNLAPYKVPRRIEFCDRI
ncbi:MAG TPA: class I adenylate-forming enzyme family protein [Kofleriaceae bacterium]|nr:class I adenylate-forming enzyme family protein [Kofleriaceae bacterium]